MEIEHHLTVSLTGSKAAMQTQTLDTLADVAPACWNELVQDGNPFLRHEFLAAMERHDCVGERTGWLPHHIVCHDDNRRLVGAAPLYIKHNSYGEFVFDWSWAQAYERHGLLYYPKLVSAIPFTPATGPRLLLAPDSDQQAVTQALIRHALNDAQTLNCSSLHWLFTTEQETRSLLAQGMMLRLGCQFHWRNPGYRDFQDFLDNLSSKRRKNIKRERRQVAQAGLDLRIVHGNQASEAQWRALHDFYASTFYRLGGYPTLTLPFFMDIADSLGERIMLVLAYINGRAVAGAISFRSDHTLYGRHWGCLAAYDSLHFEACYYQGIDYCIRHGLRSFEPGAQGEHKIWRGFTPTLTRSAHWLAHPGFCTAVADFLRRETPAVEEYARELSLHSPFRTAEAHDR